MASAFPDNDEDFNSQTSDVSTRHRLRIFYDDDSPTIPDRLDSRGRGSQRRGRGRNGGGEGTGAMMSEVSLDTITGSDEWHEETSPTGGRVSRRSDGSLDRYGGRGGLRMETNRDRGRGSRRSEGSLDRAFSSNDRRGQRRPSRGRSRGGRNGRGLPPRGGIHIGTSSHNYLSETQDPDGTSIETRSGEGQNRNNRGERVGYGDIQGRETGADGAGAAAGGARRGYNLGKLIAMSRKRDDPDGLVMEIASFRGGFADVLDSDIKPDWFYNILKILSIAITSSNNLKQTLISVLVQVERSFLSKLNDGLGEISTRAASHKNIWGNTRSLSNVCIMILQIVKELVKTLPSALGKSKTVLNNIKEIVSEFGLLNADSIIQKEIIALEEVFQALIEERKKQDQDRIANKPKRPKHKNEEGLPPEDFRTLSVLPGLRDVQMDEKPFLRANKSKGKYDDLDTYLDVQFRLLREDFIQPLRIGIAEYIQSLEEGGSNSSRKIRDIRLYRSVQIVRPVCTSEGISYMIQFDVSALKKVNWATSQRLKYGSLLCLSNDNFQTIYYATVKDRDIQRLNEGFVQVHFETMPYTDRSDTFLMAESTAYFEAFRHVLDGLQSVDASLPFQRYLIECNSVIKPPMYLLNKGVPTYDFTPIFPETKRAHAHRSADVPVLNTARWPTPQELELDASQYEALQQAITKELAIIQGPPGTGKTFIGLKIAKLLIENSSFWKPNKNGSPVLVVCFTNHALDQFLEGILTFCKTGIVRVGGRCSNKALEGYILRNLKRDKSKEKKRNWSILQNEKDCLRELRECQSEIHRISTELKKTVTDVISYNALREYMTDEQQDSFDARMVNASERECFCNWLKVNGNSSSQKEDSDFNVMFEEKHAKQLWTDHILKNVDQMTTSEAVLISDPVNVTLLDKAKLYKTWLVEYTNEIEKLKDIAEDDFKKTLIALIVRSKTHIIHPKLILQYIQSSASKPQIETVLRAVNFESWLAIDGSITSAAAIKDAIENMDYVNFDENDDGMAEDRELDSDDDEALFEYDDNDLRNRGGKDKQAAESEGNWISKWKAKIQREEVQGILRIATDISDDVAESVSDVFRIGLQHRRNLYKYWIRKFRERLRESVTGSEQRYNYLTERLKEVRDAETIQILQQAQVIGMTTTGAAKHRVALQKVKPSIVIVEEAAEVLESHIVTALSDGCKHLILIGDHKQLRPSTTVYELAKRYQMDISLFERMIKNDIPCVTLSEQHRMRPEISCMLKNKFLYPNLNDHTSVHKYGHVCGIDSDVFFIEHSQDEFQVQDSTSHQNPHEAKFLAGLCKYLLQQGYEGSQITIISPYMGQVSLIRKTMPKSEFEGVRITAVDNFQGEENDIILLSLVRSKSDGQLVLKKNPIGFLAIENRICVALSRAKMGFYVVGNFSHIKRYSELWQHIVGLMLDSKRIGKEITLRCQNHPNKVIKASIQNDFKQAPEGGCKEPCGGRLKCSHICDRVCHIIDMEHNYTKCLKPCPKDLEKCGHRCTKKCWQECGNCETKVKRKLPMCEHTAEMPCHKDPYTWNCRSKCSVLLPCGHECKRYCNDCTKSKSHEAKCKEIVSRGLACGHSVEMNCFQDPKTYQCSQPCNATLMCGHSCAGSCGACFRGKIHKICQNACDKRLPCGHECRAKCSDLCPPCNLPCEWVCSHKKTCRKKCFEECESCAENCQISCPHSKCTKLCHEACDREPCTEKCSKKMMCGHPCNALCGDICLCAEQCSVKNKNKYSAIYDKDTVFVKLSGCGCIIPHSLLEKHMLEPIPSRGELIKRCPSCKSPINSKNMRYINVLKQIRQDVIKKFSTIAGTEKKKTERARELDSVISDPTLLGLQDIEQKVLKGRLNAPGFGRLHIIGKSVELLAELFTAQEKMKKFPDVKLVFEPTQLRQIILRDRKYATFQFWDEVRNEIRRMDYYAQLETLRQNVGADFAGSDKEKLYDMCKRLLRENAPFNLKRKDVVERVLKHM